MQANQGLLIAVSCSLSSLSATIALVYTFIIAPHQPSGLFCCQSLLPILSYTQPELAFKTTAPGLSPRSEMIHWLPMSRGSKESNPNFQLDSERWHLPTGFPLTPLPLSPIHTPFPIFARAQAHQVTDRPWLLCVPTGSPTGAWVWGPARSISHALPHHFPLFSANTAYVAELGICVLSSKCVCEAREVFQKFHWLKAVKGAQHTHEREAAPGNRKSSGFCKS